MAADEGQIQNVQMKRNQKSNQCRNCTEMQNTKKGIANG